METRLPASRSSSIGPEGRFLFFHHKVKVKGSITLNQTQLNSYGKSNILEIVVIYSTYLPLPIILGWWSQGLR